MVDDPSSPWTLARPEPDERALLNVSLLRRHNQQDSLAADVPATRLERLGVIGAGIMGIGVAAAHARHGISVLLADASEEALARALPAVLEQAAQDLLGLEGKTLSTARPLPRVARARSLDELADCDLIVEAVIENADVKRRLYQQLEPKLTADAILASNTSTLSISALADCLERPERFCGLHFFNPVPRRLLVEVVCGERTSDRTIASAVAHARRIGKLPIVVGDSPGFLVNRLLTPYLNEALELLVAGATIEQIDGAAELFGMPLGPLALYDLIGIDTSFYAGRTMWEAFPDRIAASPVLPALFRKGRLGQKSGAGFYRYDTGCNAVQPDPRAAELLEPYVRRQAPLPAQEIIERLLLPVLLEATRVLAEDIVRDVRDVDLGMIYGLGYPAERGGLLFWADTLGTARIVDMLQRYQPLGRRFEPTTLLLEMARERRGFYTRL